MALSKRLSRFSRLRARTLHEKGKRIGTPAETPKAKKRTVKKAAKKKVARRKRK